MIYLASQARRIRGPRDRGKDGTVGELPAAGAAHPHPGAVVLSSPSRTGGYALARPPARSASWRSSRHWKAARPAAWRAAPTAVPLGGRLPDAYDLVRSAAGADQRLAESSLAAIGPPTGVWNSGSWPFRPTRTVAEPAQAGMSRPAWRRWLCGRACGCTSLLIVVPVLPGRGLVRADPGTGRHQLSWVTCFEWRSSPRSPAVCGGVCCMKRRAQALISAPRGGRNKRPSDDEPADPSSGPGTSTLARLHAESPTRRKPPARISVTARPQKGRGCASRASFGVSGTAVVVQPPGPQVAGLGRCRHSRGGWDDGAGAGRGAVSSSRQSWVTGVKGWYSANWRSPARPWCAWGRIRLLRKGAGFRNGGVLGSRRFWPARRAPWPAR